MPPLPSAENGVNLALAHLRRRPWLATLPTFDATSTCAGGDQAPRRSSREMVETGIVAARRTTCELTPARLARFSAAAAQLKPGRRPLVVVHAVDADPAVPLLLYWSLDRLPMLAAACTWLSTEFAADVQIVVPGDLPNAWRKLFPRTARIVEVDSRYPAGHWRLLPRLLKGPTEATLVIDAVAATDLMSAAVDGRPVEQRPFAILDATAGTPPRFTLARRGLPVASLLDQVPAVDAEDAPDVELFVGTRLSQCRLGEGELVGDGELTLHIVPREAPAQSPCVRCGWCVSVCPTRCDPLALMRLNTYPHPARARRAGLDACIDCGLCTAVCPSNLPLHGYIAQLRTTLAAHAHSDQDAPAADEVAR